MSSYNSNKNIFFGFKFIQAMNWKIFIGSICSIFIIGFCLYNFLILPQLDVWGATPEEIAMSLPGDSIVPGIAIWQMTVAKTIDAPPEKIFPYFIQAGQDKAGFYSFDRLERFFGFGIHNTYTINPEWQDLKAGDFCTFHKSGMGMRIHEVIKNKRITMITNGLDADHSLPEGKWEMLLQPLFPRGKGHYIAWNWDFNLFPLDSGKTRVVVRCKASAKGGLFAKFFFKHAFALPSDIMDIEMLRRVKKLAEGTYSLN